MCALAAVGKPAACRKIVLEAEQNRGADFEGVGVAVDIFKNKELVVVLVALLVAYTNAGNPGSFRHESHLLEVSLERFLCRCRQHCCNQ